MPIILEYWHRLLLHVRASIENLLTTQWAFFSVPEYVIKKGRPHGHRYGGKARRQRILSG